MTQEPQDVARAVKLLQAGELVAFPTETVYGLGADAANPAAVARIFTVKGRPVDHPLIVHLPGAAHLDRWASRTRHQTNPVFQQPHGNWRKRSGLGRLP